MIKSQPLSTEPTAIPVMVYDTKTGELRDAAGTQHGASQSLRNCAAPHLTSDGSRIMYTCADGTFLVATNTLKIVDRARYGGLALSPDGRRALGCRKKGGHAQTIIQNLRKNTYRVVDLQGTPCFQIEAISPDLSLIATPKTVNDQRQVVMHKTKGHKAWYLGTRNERLASDGVSFGSFSIDSNKVLFVSGSFRGGPRNNLGGPENHWNLYTQRQP